VALNLRIFKQILFLQQNRAEYNLFIIKVAIKVFEKLYDNSNDATADNSAPFNCLFG